MVGFDEGFPFGMGGLFSGAMNEDMRGTPRKLFTASLPLKIGLPCQKEKAKVFQASILNRGLLLMVQKSQTTTWAVQNPKK